MPNVPLWPDTLILNSTRKGKWQVNVLTRAPGCEHVVMGKGRHENRDKARRDALDSLARKVRGHRNHKAKK
jgi:hypothetical protein